VNISNEIFQLQANGIHVGVDSYPAAGSEASHFLADDVIDERHLVKWTGGEDEVGRVGPVL